MKLNNENPGRKYVAGGVVLAALVGVGCAVAQETTHSTGSNALAPAAPVLAPSEPAIKNAAEMQSAFAQVAKVAEPAVVTITTEQRVRRTRNSGPGRLFGPQGPGSGNPFGGDDSEDDANSLQDFFRQFNGGGGGFSPNSYRGSGGDTIVLHSGKANFRLTQGTPRTGPSAPQMGQLVQTGLGSGFIYDSSGLILTNAHVVAGADVVTVKLLDGREFRNAKVLGSDERGDVAVVKIPATDLPTVKLGDSSNISVGDWAIAVGNPYGLENTLTVGVISAKAREVDLTPNAANDYLQTDASINPGNSGGPLLDIYGRVIGINNAIYSRSGGNVGIGFAIPINTARDIAAQLATSGRVRRAQLGVHVGDLDKDNAAAFGVPTGTEGAVVEDVEPGSAAAKAGLQTGDIITVFNGEKVARSADLVRRVSQAPIGQSATLTVLRGGKSLTITAAPTEVKDDAKPNAANGKSDDNVAPNTPKESTTIGVGLAPLTPDLARRFGLPSGAAGVIVAQVAPDSAAGRAGIRPGDLISRVGQTTVATPQEASKAVRDLLANQKLSPQGNKAVALYVTRGKESQYVVVTVPQS